MTAALRTIDSAWTVWSGYSKLDASCPLHAMAAIADVGGLHMDAKLNISGVGVISAVNWKMAQAHTAVAVGASALQWKAAALLCGLETSSPICCTPRLTLARLCARCTAQVAQKTDSSMPL